MSTESMGTGWMARAGCADTAPELFFPVAVSGPVFEAQVLAAKRVCAGCSVRAECLAFAAGSLADGIAGGLTAEERRGLGGPQEVAAGLAPGATARERAGAGRAAIREGRPVAAVAREFGVSKRAALRWAADVRRERGRREQARARGVERGAA